MSTDEFFDEKRAWSLIKDRILGSYLKPYLHKVKRRGKEIILVDSFAGPGIFGEEHSPGSPLIIGKAANEVVPNQHRSYFINIEPKYHQQLSAIIEKAKWSRDFPILGDAKEEVEKIIRQLGDRTFFLYIDPFGLSAFPFSVLEPLLNRKTTSTEIFITINADALHRLAARNRVAEGSVDEKILNNHRILTEALGGDYWKNSLLDSDSNLSAKEREQRVIDGFRMRLASSGYLQYTGACPIQLTANSKTKFYLVFAAPHIDALVLLNDAMMRAFGANTFQQEFKNSLFADMNWQEWRDTRELQQIVLSEITRLPNRSREEIWKEIVRKHFFKFLKTEYHDVVTALVKSGQIKFESSTGKLNPEAKLYI